MYDSVLSYDAGSSQGAAVYSQARIGGTTTYYTLMLCCLVGQLYEMYLWGVADGSVAKSIFAAVRPHVNNAVAHKQSRHSRELLRSSQTSETEPTSARRKMEPTQAR